jgi:hypothetical protein
MLLAPYMINIAGAFLAVILSWRIAAKADSIFSREASFPVHETDVIVCFQQWSVDLQTMVGTTVTTMAGIVLGGGSWASPVGLLLVALAILKTVLIADSPSVSYPLGIRRFRDGFRKHRVSYSELEHLKLDPQPGRRKKPNAHVFRWVCVANILAMLAVVISSPEQPSKDAHGTQATVQTLVAQVFCPESAGLS